MKYILLLSFLCGSAFSQTQKERDFIISQSNPLEVSLLKRTVQDDFLKNQREIAAYLLLHPETKNKENLQRIIDGVPIFYQVDTNARCAQTLRANTMYPSGSLGLSVTGQGITLGIWDGGRVLETHQEFVGGRLTIGDNATTASTHATHVLGTMIASGVSVTRRGLAYQASAIAYDFNGDAPEFTNFASLGYLASNHSYGNVAANLPDGTFGAYNSQSVEVDNVMNVYPYYQMVKSAGNDRDNTNLNQVLNKGGYDLLSGAGTSKNVITVAAVEGIQASGDNSFVMSSFSNFGPTDDGRVKPDLSSKGVAVNSSISISNTSYGDLQGTSMASPGITGLIALLQKHYNNLNAGTFMRSATLRALLFVTARESGDANGPDYRFGWGLPDGGAAAQVITNKGTSTIMEENVLNNGEVYTKTVSITTAQNISVDLAWTDRQGTSNGGEVDNRTPRLVNNLDLKVLRNGVTYYPWKLDPEAPEDPATNDSDNNVDNSERVNIYNAPPGVYTIQVSHKGTLVGGLQNYSLVALSTNGLGVNSRDFENDVYVYPNPANSILNFEFKNDIQLSGVSINDISGKEVYRSSNVINNSIDVSNLSSGVYFVTLKSDTNSVVKKFIKE